MGQIKTDQTAIHVVNVIEEARIGGPQKRIVAVGKALARDGISTSVVTIPVEHEDFAEQCAEVGLKFHTVNVVRLRQTLFVLPRYALTFFRDILRYKKLFAKIGANIVHTNGASQWRPAIAAKLAGIPVVWHLNDTRCPWPIRCPFNVFSRFCASGFLVSSNRTREVYLKPDESRPVILARPPVETQRFARAAKKKNQAPLVVSTIGNLNPDKDILTLIRLAQKANARFGEDMVFKVAGRRLGTQPDYNSKIDAQLAQEPHNIEFLGYCDDVNGLLKETDVFVCTSSSEAGPMSVFEAFAAGVPVLTTDVGDIRDICREHGEIAAVAPVGDTEVLYNYLTAIVDQDQFETLASAGQVFARKHLDVSQCAEAHAQIYKSLWR